MKNDEIIGRKLTELRKSKGYTLQKVSDRFGWNRSTLCKYEKGQRQVTADVFIELLDFYEVDDVLALFKELLKEFDS